MGTEFLKHQKDCATCQKWGGPRKLTVNKNSGVESGLTKGLCSRSKRETNANYSGCPFFEKWDQLP